MSDLISRSALIKTLKFNQKWRYGSGSMDDIDRVIEDVEKFPDAYCSNCGAKMYKSKESDDEVKKVFISQPMNGYSDAEILRIRGEAVTKAAVKLGPIKVIDSFFERAPTDAKPLWYLGESLKKLSEADAVYFAKGWQNARGCRIEHEAAVAYFKEVVYE